MKLRYHPNLSSWVTVNTEEFKNALNFLPFNEVSTAVDVFRNDFVSFIFQNALKNYAITDFYKSINSSTIIPSKEVTSLTRGAFVKNDASGQPTLYLDIPTLRMQFKYKMYDKDSGYENDYEDLNLYPVSSKYFTSFRQTNEATYFAFVAEREYLRYSTSKASIEKTAEYKDAVKDLKAEYPKMPLVKREKLAYEKVLAMRALDNTFNFYKLFKDPEQSFAVKVGNLLNKPYMKKLKLQYEVLQKLTPDTDSNNSIFNIYINEKDYTTSKADLYYKNLKDLANPAVIKVADPVENERISSIFAMVPIVALLQTGFNKTKLNFTNVVDIDMFLNLVEDQMPEVMEILNDSEKADQLLSKFFELYKKENADSTTRSRFKNFFMLNGLSEYATKENQDAPSREFMKGTSNPNLFIYTQSDNSPKHYKKVVDSNPDVVFVYNVTQAEIDDPSKAFKGNSRIEPYAENMSVPFITSFQTAGDNFISLSSKEYPRVISDIEKAINEIKELVKSNIPVAFPSEGFGDADIMPQQLFVYLSKRLYEEFNYINPGSTQYKEMLSLIEETEGISDRIVDELLLDKDEDPFKCNL